MMLDGIKETGEKHNPKSNFMAEYHVVADNTESLLPLTEDDFHPENDPQMDFSSYTRQAKFSKTKAVSEDGSKSLKRASTSENIALERETHINRKTSKWSSSDGQFNELAGSISPDLNAQRNRSPSVSPKRCWGRSNRSRSSSPSCGSTFGSKRWENRGRTRGGLIVHGRDFSDSKDGSKRSNCFDMTAVQTARRSGVTNKEIKGLVPALDPSDDLNRSISPGLEPRRQDIYTINPKHGCSRSERNFVSNKDGAKMSNWETASGNQTTNEDGYSTRHGGGGWSATLRQSEELDRSISVDHQRWRRQSPSISPKHSWRIRKRSRSRSPSLGLKPGMENWNTRGRTAGRSAVPYRDFAAEKLGKGSHFREISEDEAWRHSGYASREFGEGRLERGRYSGYHRRENFDDRLEQKDVSRDRLLQRELSHHDGIWEKHERHQNNRSTDHHYISTKERYPQVSTCNFDHHDGNSHSPWPIRDGARERNYNRRDADSPFRQRPKSRRVSDTPCKYFAIGSCRRGEDCKFSHHPKGWRQDDKQDRNMRIERVRSLNDSKLGNGASAMDAPISSHEMHNGNGSRMSNPSSVDDEVSGKSKDAQSKAFESPEQNTTEDAFEQYDSAVSVDMMIKGAQMEQIISNKEQVSSEGGCDVGDTARSQTEMGSATLPAAAISFTEKSLSRSMSEQLVDPEVHISAPNAQYMKGASLSPSGKTLQETMCSIPPNGNSQLGISQMPSPTNRRMHSASEVGHSEQIQQSPVSHKNGLSQQIVPKGQSNQQMHSAAEVGHSEQIQQSPLSYKNGLSRSIDHSVVPKGQSNHMFSQDHPNSHLILISDDESEQQADNSNERSSQLTSGTSANQVLVITEEVAHVTDLSSPSQVCQQPSQLHATLTPIGPAGSMFPEMTSKPSMVKLPSPPQGFLVPHHNQTPASDGCCKDVHLDENENRQNGELEPHHNQTPVSDNRHEDVHLDENESRQNGKFELKPLNPAEEVTVSNKSQNQEVHVPPSEVVEQDVQVDGRNKNTKETNGMKMFKFALVEFVKDQLKPSWKEGHLSREAHKAIVKKVVDKVTNSVKGPNFPQTQQKINLYMEHSKSKLSKLVQAYVARSIKS